VSRRGKALSRRFGCGAFTLIELLVVIAIIALLVTILAPSLRQVEDILKRVVCRSNMRQLTLAWTNYHLANDGMLVGADTGDFGATWDWAGQWGNMKAGKLWAYVETPKPYKCTNPANPGYPISYSIAGSMNGQAADFGPTWRSIWGSLPWKTYTTLPRPSECLVLVEEDDWRGFNMASWVLWNKDQWVDYVSGNHDDGDNLTFADGHTEYWHWEVYNTLAYPHQDAPFYKPDPGNWDLHRLWEIYACVDVLQ